MALQGHIEYLRRVLKSTEYERNDARRERDEAWRERDRTWREVGDANGERDRAWREKGDADGERDNARKERDEAYGEREKARKERDDANTELGQLREKLKTASSELVAMKAERAQLQEQLNVLLGRGADNGGAIGEGSGGQAAMIQQLYLRQRHGQSMNAVQNDETREHRIGRYVQYAGLAKADMLFWETMVETESRLEGLIAPRDMSRFYGSLLIWRAW